LHNICAFKKTFVPVPIEFVTHVPHFLFQSLALHQESMVFV